MIHAMVVSFTSLTINQQKLLEKLKGKFIHSVSNLHLSFFACFVYSNKLTMTRRKSFVVYVKLSVIAVVYEQKRQQLLKNSLKTDFSLTLGHIMRLTYNILDYYFFF